ncbi:hypothetical protein C8A03DRAFT_38812 [Achaetomium macrosporum]|uniref:SET domain-containing protein n=1 Tax=Achaetomium macrosporum TaxID=79813 RepID=A0AAN7C1F3_9PEZI|nr:hypothetical protein C8A03DRAFT_38812 [Achaetomium macrosporum]
MPSKKGRAPRAAAGKRKARASSPPGEHLGAIPPTGKRKRSANHLTHASSQDIDDGEYLPRPTKKPRVSTVNAFAASTHQGTESPPADEDPGSSNANGAMDANPLAGNAPGKAGNEPKDGINSSLPPISDAREMFEKMMATQTQMEPGHFKAKIDKKIDLNRKVACDCINQLSCFWPRIKDYGKKGLGLQAIASTHGQVAYRKGETIGYLFGKIVPIKTYEDCWALDFVRPDINGEPVVCQLDYRGESNIFRLLNHDCEPSARLNQKIVLGRWVVAVEAITDILDGVEITVSYG